MYEYKFFQLPATPLFNKGKTINDVRIPILEEEFNNLGKDGWYLFQINWIEGIVVFKREIKE